MRHTQKELIMDYVRKNGSIRPSHLTDSDRVSPNGFIGSEAKRRCCELRNAGELESRVEKTFVIFTLPQKSLKEAEQQKLFESVR